MPNLVKFREDPDAMLVMSLEDYDEATGKAAKAAILLKDVVGKTPPVTHVRIGRGRVCSCRSNQRGTVDLPYIATLYGKPEEADHRRTGRPDLPRPGLEDLADRRRLSVGQRAGQADSRRSRRPEFARNAEALRGRAAGGRAARRHRRQSRCAVDTGERHPGIRRRSVPCRHRPRSRSAT